MKLFTGWIVLVGLFLAAATANAQGIAPDETSRAPYTAVSDVSGPFAANPPPEAPVGYGYGPSLLPPQEVYTVLREVGFAPLDDTGAQLLFRFVAAAYERRALAIASHWPFESWGHFLPEHTTAVSLLDRLLHHANVVVTSGDSYRMRQARAKGGTTLKQS